MRVLPLLLVVLVVLALPAAAAEQTLYKWTDQDGVTHYTDDPPPDGEFEVRELSVEVPPAVPLAAAEPVPPNPNCVRVRANLETLERPGEVRMDLDGDGTAELLSVPQREQQAGIARQQIALYCDSVPAAPPADAGDDVPVDDATAEDIVEDVADNDGSVDEVVDDAGYDDAGEQPQDDGG